MNRSVSYSVSFFDNSKGIRIVRIGKKYRSISFIFSKSKLFFWNYKKEWITSFTKAYYIYLAKIFYISIFVEKI